MFCMLKMKKHPAYVSKHNSNHEKQVILLIISNRETHKAKSEGWQLWHYLAVKKLVALLRRITSKHHVSFIACLHSFTTKEKVQLHKKVCENKDFCNIIIPSEDTKKSEFNQYEKYDKARFIIHADLECIIEKTDRCKNNSESNLHQK